MEHLPTMTCNDFNKVRWSLGPGPESTIFNNWPLVLRDRPSNPSTPVPLVDRLWSGIAVKAKHEVCREARVSQHIPNTLHAEVTSSDSTPDSADMVTSVSTPVHQLEVTEVAETTVAPPERSSQTPWRVVEPHCPYPAAENTPVSVSGTADKWKYELASTLSSPIGNEPQLDNHGEPIGHWSYTAFDQCAHACVLTVR